MSTLVKSALGLRFGGGSPPPWVEAFLGAVEHLEPLDPKHEKGKRERRLAHMAGDECRKRRGEVVVAVMNEEEEMQEELRMFEAAEGELRRAIELGNGKEPLPYSWLSSVFVKLERWPQASEAALQAVQIDPLSHSLLFHLSHCYEQERECVKALEYYEHAVSLVPLFDNGSYAAKLLRLQEQADDQKAHVFRGDPMEMLPLEIVIAIMQEGLLSDEYFVLRNSWVNQRWRNTLLNLKDLWSCLRYASAELRDKSYEAKRDAWVARAGKQLHTICFEELNSTNISKLTKATDAKLLKSIRNLKVSVKEPLALTRFSEKFVEICEKLKHLEIDGGYDPWNGRLRTGDPPTRIDCGFAFNWYSNSVKTISVFNVDFRSLRGIDSYASWSFYAFPGGHGFGSLKRLEVGHCAFNNSYRTTTPVVPDYVDEYDGIYQSDPLHRALRSAEELEYLSVVPGGKTLESAAQPGTGRRKELPLLHYGHPPTAFIWAIDIDAPNLRRLQFVLSSQDSFAKYMFTAGPSTSATPRPLIPTVAASPASLESLTKLESLAFECSYRDDIARLEEWISQTPNLERLSISGSGMPYPKKLATPNDPDNRAYIRILQLLLDHPEYLPRLKELKLEHCWARGEKLIEWVQRRKASDLVFTLERLTLDRCSTMSQDEHKALTQEVKHFEAVRAMPDVNTGGGDYEDRHYLNASYQSRYIQQWS